MLVRWNPLRDLETLHGEIDRIFDEAVGRPVMRGETRTASWVPTVDIHEDQDGVNLSADLPGMTQKDVKVNIDNGILTLSGERKLERENKKESYHRLERFYGSFSRSFSLPNTVNTEKVDARMEHGVLKIHLPKREEAKPKQIEIKVS
ncbi:MAG: Hsp20/alpha crystallin family protein [bacterium]